MYRWVDHTAEVELHVEAGSEAEVFSEALTALGELMSDEGTAETASYTVSAAAPDHAALLVEWLNEVVYLAETEALVPERVERLQLEDRGVESTVAGRKAAARPLVKAATYHGLELAERDGSWRATVVFDV